VVGVLAGGSTARGHADQFSDVELMVLWSTAPTDLERRAVITAAGGDLHWLWPYDPASELWEDAYFMGRNEADDAKSGCLLEVSHCLVPTVIARIEQVVVQSLAEEDLLNLMAGIVDGHILVGADLISPWKDQIAPYPDALQRAVLERYGSIDHFWRWAMYLRRGPNMPELYGMFTTILHHVMHLILAVNRRYFGGWKWIAPTMEHCHRRPDRFMERANALYHVPPQEGAALLAALVDETFDLVERHVVGVDVHGMRALFHWQRPQWSGPPPCRLPLL
jgi:hypothetical protein